MCIIVLWCVNQSPFHVCVDRVYIRRYGCGVITRGEWLLSDGRGPYTQGGHTIGIAKKSHTQTTARVWRCCFTMFASEPGGRGKNCQGIHWLFEVPGVDKQSLLVVWIVGGIYDSLKKKPVITALPIVYNREKLYNSTWISALVNILSGSVFRPDL